MADGTSIAYDLYEPDGTAPAGGWPGVVVLHGLGGSKDSVASIAQVFAAHGLRRARLLRARPRHLDGQRRARRARTRSPTSARCSTFLAGPARGERHEDRRLGHLLRRRPDLERARRRASPTRRPRSSRPGPTSTRALWPQDIAKSGIVLGFAKAVEARSPLIAANENDAIHSTNLGAIKALVAPRSSLREALPRSRRPSYMFQGRVDYAFDVDAGRERLQPRSPGRSISTSGSSATRRRRSPAPTSRYVMAQGVAWFDHYLRGAPNGIDKSKPVTIAAAKGTKRTSYAGLPKTKVDQRRLPRHDASPHRADVPAGARDVRRLAAEGAGAEGRRTTRASSRRSSPATA